MHRYRYATGDVCSSIQGAKSILQQRVARGKDTIGKWAKNKRAVAEIIANNLEHILHRDPTRKKGPEPTGDPFSVCSFVICPQRKSARTRRSKSKK